MSGVAKIHKLSTAMAQDRVEPAAFHRWIMGGVDKNPPRIDDLRPAKAVVTESTICRSGVVFTEEQKRILPPVYTD